MKKNSLKRGLAVALSVMMLVPNVSAQAEEEASSQPASEVVVESEQPAADNAVTPAEDAADDKAGEKENTPDADAADKEADADDADAADKEADADDADAADKEADADDADAADKEADADDADAADKEADAADKEADADVDEAADKELGEEDWLLDEEYLLENEDVELEPQDEVLFNTGNCAVSVYKLENTDSEEAEYIPHFDEYNKYTIEIPEMNPYFPYEVQFTYDGKVENEWFMSPDDSVQVGDYTFYVEADYDNTVVTQMSLSVGGKEVVVYPEEKEFSNDGIMVTSLLPLEEQYFNVNLTGFSPLELTMVKMSNVFAGDKELKDTDKIAWTRTYDDDNYSVSAADGSINMSRSTTTSNQTYEMIVGDADQLNMENIRYIVSVNITDSEHWLNTSKIYAQNEAGERTECQLSNKNRYYDYDTSDREYNLYTTANYSDFYNREAYVSLDVDTDAFPNLDVSKIKAYEGNYSTAQTAVQGTDITSRLFASDMSQKDAGYKLTLYKDTWVTLVLYDDNNNVTGCLPFQLYLTISDNQSYVYPRMYDGQTYIDDTYSISTSNGKVNETVTLYKEYPANGHYNLRLNYYPGDGDGYSDNNKVTAAYVGEYASIAAATSAGAADIKNKLILSSGFDGYTADYSNGVTFTIIAGEDGAEAQDVLHVTVTTKTGENSKNSSSLSSNTLVSFRGLRDAAGNSIDAYFVNQEEDSYSEYNYLTMLVAADVDLSNVAPTFYKPNTINLYAAGSSAPEVSGKSYHDFSKGPVQYTASAEDGKNARNYWLQIVKATDEDYLYVNSLVDSASATTTKDGVITSKREMVIDSYHNNVHDILLVNMSTKAISNISATLTSDKLVLDDYWTLSGNQELLGFNGTDNSKYYGELQNMAKVRIRAKDGVSGVADGTLEIKSGDKTLMLLQLTADIGDPIITTEEIPQAVKYVPYGTMIQNNNKYSWNRITYYRTSGSLPKGMELKSNGEIYGVPKETGEFTFTVRMNVSTANGSSSDTKEFILTVLDNTNENVAAATDEGYEVSTRIADVAEGSSTAQLFVSQGQYGTFKYVYLDGEKLEQNTDFTSESGSTRITILAETMKKLPKGVHTLGVEFRDDTDTLKRAAQNFGVGVTTTGETIDSSDTNNDSNNNSNNDSDNDSNNNSNNGSDNGNNNNGSNSSNNNSSSSSASTGTASTTAAAKAVEPVISDEQVDAQGLPYVDAVLDPKNAKLKLELLQKYYGRNIYIMAHLGNGIGYSIAMAEAAPTEDLDLSSSLQNMPDFAEGFDTFYMHAVKKVKLPYTIGLHINVGAEYVGHTAYIFRLDTTAGTYVINNIMTVNEIGNVCASLNELTDVMILVMK